MAPGQERVPHGGKRYAARGGEIVDLTEDIKWNYEFFRNGPGHDA